MAYDSSLVVYTNVPLPYINVTPGMNLQTILQNINTAVNTLNPVPNYSTFNYGPYYGYTLTDPLGGTITTITQFVEGTANGIGKVSSDLNTFTGTTYPADQTILSSAIVDLQIPGLAYSHTAGGLSITISNTDNQLTVLTKLATAIGNTGDLLAAPGSTWSTLSLSNPTNINSAFNSLIAYISGMNTTITGKQSSLGTFNATGIGGGATDSPVTTINEIITYVQTLPSFNGASITTTCLGTIGNKIEDWIQALTNVADNYITYYVSVDGTSLTDSGVAGDCSGRTFSVNPTWQGLFKVNATSSDASPDSLDQKIVAGTNVTITPINSNTQLEISVPFTGQYKVKTNNSDPIPNYLSSKIVGGLGEWGLNVAIEDINNVLNVNLYVNDPSTFVQNILNYIGSNPNLLSQLCTLNSQCSTNGCDLATNFTVTYDNNAACFNLTWTPGGSLLSQVVKYRLIGDIVWVTGANIVDNNPQTAIATSAIVTPGCLNTIIEFQIDSVCSIGTTSGAIVQNIQYNQQTLSANVTSLVITVTQPAMPNISIIEYVLYTSLGLPIDTQIASGSNPIATFSNPAIIPGNYYVEYRYGTSINGTLIYSDDVVYNGAYYTSGTIIVT